MSILSPRAAQMLRRLTMRQQEQIRNEIFNATSDLLSALQGDAVAGNVLFYDGNDWLAVGGTPSEGAVLTIVSGIPTWV